MVRRKPASRHAGRRGRALAAAAAALGVIAAAPNPMGAHAAEPAPRGTGAQPVGQPVGQFPAFVLDRRRYTGFDAPESGVQLAPFGINNRGVIAGEYLRPASESGFVRDARGRFTVIDIPGAKGTEAVKINDRGQIVGIYENPDATPGPQRVGMPPGSSRPGSALRRR